MAYTSPYGNRKCSESCFVSFNNSFKASNTPSSLNLKENLDKEYGKNKTDPSFQGHYRSATGDEWLYMHICTSIYLYFYLLVHTVLYIYIYIYIYTKYWCEYEVFHHHSGIQPSMQKTKLMTQVTKSELYNIH